MNNWVVTNIDTKIRELSTKSIIKCGNFYFGSDFQNQNIYKDPESNDFIHITGYILARLEFKKRSKNTYKDLLDGLRESGISYLNYFKGQFIIVAFVKSKLIIANDQLGILKFFYHNSKKGFFVSNSIKSLVKLKGDVVLSKSSISSYFVFNYLINGRTFYQDINSSLPGEFIALLANDIKIDKYFDISEFIIDNNQCLSGRKLFPEIANRLSSIITQYDDYADSKLALTLTAGLDSRILLGCLLKSNKDNFETFTFGKEGSYDVKFAKIIANKVNINHRHFYPDSDFFENFSLFADRTFKSGHTLTSIFRAHRLDAYAKVSHTSSNIIMGLAGSDLVRGLGYDELIFSPIAFHLTNNKSIDTFFNSSELINRYRKIIDVDFLEIANNLDEYNYIRNPLEYLFRVVIPMHFAQDIYINQNLGIKTFVPFLDIDYLQLLKETPYFKLETFNKFRAYDLRKRMSGLKFSSKLVYEINSEISRIPIGKGYSPKDVKSSVLLALMKSKLYKRKNKHMFKVANFGYSEWFWKYLTEYFQNTNLNTLINKNFAKSNLNTMRKSGGELYYSDFVKIINIQKAGEEILP